MILHHDVFGELAPDVTPLVLLHGLFGSGTNWRTLARRFAAELPVITFDARNHGRSAHADQMSYAEMAADVEASLAALDVRQAHILGHSMGGKTAMTLALTSPACVTSLIVADIAPIAYQRGLGPELGLMQGLPLTTIKRRADADAALRDALPDPGLRAFLLQNLEIRSDGTRWRLNLDAIEAAGALLTGFDAPDGTTYLGPASFIRGGMSDYLSPDHDVIVADRFPRAVSLTIDGAGHWLHAEQPDAFAERVIDHLRSLA
ncbi:MAG: alpha/beta fold hydrolase [Pseudomonadota bacterium]